MTSLRFRDRMAGHLSFQETDFTQALLDGRRARRRCAFDLDIAIDDVDAFLADPELEARATGRLRCAELGGTLEVPEGSWNLFLPGTGHRGGRMRYRLFTRGDGGGAMTLSGFKDVADGPNLDVWADTTTLFVRLMAGRVELADEEADPGACAERVIATGILRISPWRFLTLLASVRARGGPPGRHARAAARVAGRFAGELLHTYGGRPVPGHLPDFPDPAHPGDERWHGVPEGRWHDTPELPGLRRRILGLRTEDGRDLTLHNVRRRDEDGGRTPVLLLHGTGVRANLFYGAPGRPSLVAALSDAGFDVWLSNWRASIDLPPADYTLDEAARYDHPAAIARVLAETGAPALRVLAHCQGSTSFVITAIAGLADGVERVVSSAVSLHPVVPRLSRIKITTMVPALGLLTPYVSAQWGARPPTPLAAAVGLLARTTRRECDDPVCALGNYMYGAGPDVLWRHANLDERTHHWTSREFGAAPLRFLRQMRRSVLAGHLVNVDGLDGLPAGYVEPRVPLGVPWTFIAGGENRLFTAESQGRTFAFFDAIEPGRHRLHVIPGYGHLDVLFGRDAATDAFGLILDGLGPA